MAGKQRPKKAASTALNVSDDVVREFIFVTGADQALARRALQASRGDLTAALNRHAGWVGDPLPDESSRCAQ